MFKLGWTQFLPFIITVAAILGTDLLIGIGIGLAASIVFVLKNNYTTSAWVSTSQSNGKTVYTMQLAERVFFMNKGTILNKLARIEDGSILVIDASDTVYIDQDVLDIFDDFETNAEFKDIQVKRIQVANEAKESPERVRLKIESNSNGDVELEEVVSSR